MDDTYDTPTTRPRTAPRQTARTANPRKVKRYTLDLEHEQHIFLKLFALQRNISASRAMRTMLYLLENDKTFADRVLAEMYSDDTPLDDNDD